MAEQNFVYVDVNYLKELEETAKKVDYYKGIIDGINMVIDRKTEQTEPQTENPCDGCVCDDGKHLMYCMHCKGIAWKTEPPKVEDEPQTERSE